MNSLVNYSILIQNNGKYEGYYISINNYLNESILNNERSFYNFNWRPYGPNNKPYNLDIEIRY